MNTKSTAISIALIISMVLCLWIAPKSHASNSAGATAVTYNNTSVSGQITCTSIVQGPNLSENGSISVVADGNGSLTSGNASYRATSGMSCNYALSSGTYRVQSDGTGQATTNWSLVSQNSSPTCAPTVSNNAISFSIKNTSFAAPVQTGGSENGNCTVPPSATSSQ
jgi:hypothetical protein